MAYQSEDRMKELEGQYQEGKWLSFNHISELYLYEYYVKDMNFQLADQPMNHLYKDLGGQYEADGQFEQAKVCYEKAITWNPVDLDALFAKIEIEKKLLDMEAVRTETLQLYPYLCTRATMARFYRNLGFYYVEKYKPELAVMLYQYSELFFETDNAKQEIAYLEKALGKEFAEYDVHDLQAAIAKEQIPVSAPTVTLGLLYEVGKSEEKKNHIAEATDCYLMVYDLTQDEEVKERLKRITN